MSLSMTRSSNSITISEYLENHELKKYNYSPDYQRHGEVWNNEQKSFLMDSIFKNYPMPPIFLRSILDNKTGKTKYDVIDGKQRLETIRDFVDGKVSLPENFSDDIYGSSLLNGLTHSEIQELENEELDIFKSNFWNYSIPIEYITITNTSEKNVVNTIFDRLNRYGEPLNPQELRNSNANYYDLIRYIKTMKKTFWINRLEEAVSINRMEDDEFISELIFTLLEDDYIDSSPAKIDNLYKTWSDNYENINKQQVQNKFIEVTSYIEDLDIDYEGFKIKGISHLYGLWGFSKYCVEQGIDIKISRPILIDFFEQLRSKGKEGKNFHVEAYRNSMSSATRTATQRKRRVDALIKFLEKNG
ncbi:hypothetical protein PGLA_08690 [Paenibacillus glacialis]|uniref:GmrSD restriction endonucleases N-terminal domain-containing protein n=2 Tax=Paenibacillus glacialis TaxID=494026 RepID=A0A162K5Z9_9BACL|nr:hypothetical protein PGLA_08690 [Paenibacillus glacialis]